MAERYALSIPKETMKNGRENVVVIAPHHGVPHTMKRIAIHCGPHQSERDPAKGFATEEQHVSAFLNFCTKTGTYKSVWG